jgi:UDP-N-acetylglucosamine:LPS N-acetylglucosamine transferase
VADAGGAVIVRESGDVAARVLSIVRELDADRDMIKTMSERSRSVAPVDATDIIYKTVMETYRQRIGRR